MYPEQTPVTIDLIPSIVTTSTKHREKSNGAVVVIGGGLSGIATSIHLAQLDFQVTCIEPVLEFDSMVGESLDWSAPELLGNLGLPMEELIRKEVCTYKRHVIVRKEDGSQAEYAPSDWLAKPPFHVELRTLHVDRLRLHKELSRLADSSGVSILRDRVTRIENRGDRITCLHTAGGRAISSEWFVDASGSSASVFGRALNLPAIEYGPKKVAFWSYAGIADWQEGTTIYAEAPERAYMNWVWEIPVNPDTVSVGYVSGAEEFKKNRREGESAEAAYWRHLAKFDRFQEMSRTAAGDSVPIHATSFRCRAYRRVCGANWLIVGEAASLPDPITGNGVTAALRHAAEGARLIHRSRGRRRLSFWSRLVYNLRVRHMGRFFNSLIEKLAYEWPVRDRIGLLRATDAYTIPAWSVNHIYSRIQPDGMASTLLFCGFLTLLRGAAWCVYQFCRVLPSSERWVEGYAACT